MIAVANLVMRLSGLLLAAMWLIAALVKRDSVGSVVARVTWVMPTLVIVALLLPNVWLLMAILLVFLPVVARSKADAAALYVVALVSLPTISIYAKAGETALLAIDNYRVLSLGLLLAALMKPGPRGKVSWLAAVPMLVFFALDVIALGRGQNATSLFRVILEAVLHWILPFLAVSLAVSRVEDVKRVILALIVSAGGLCVVAVYQAKTFWPMYENVITHYGINLSISQGSKIRGGLMRAGASFGESTSFGWYLVIILLLTSQARSRFRGPIHFSIMIGLLGVGLLLTQARGAWLGAAIGLVLLDIYHRRLINAGIKIFGAGVCYLAAVSFASKLGMFSDVLSSHGGAQTTIDYRAQLLERGLSEIRLNPFLGYDLQTVQSRLADLRQGEGIIDFVNAYVYYGLTTGVFGAIAFGLAFLGAAWIAVGQKGMPLHAQNMGAPALFAVSGMTFVLAGTSGFGGNPAFFFIILLALGTVRPSVNERHRLTASNAVDYGPAIQGSWSSRPSKVL